MLAIEIKTDIFCYWRLPEDSVNTNITDMVAGEVKMNVVHPGLASQELDWKKGLISDRPYASDPLLASSMPM